MSAKVPVAIACSLIALALGSLAGVAAMSGLGYKWERQIEGAEGPPPMMPPGAGRGIPGGGGGGGGGGGRPPMSKIQLTALVNKLDQLMQKPLHIQLTAAEKKKVQDQLQGLSEKDEISDEEAKKRLDALLDVLKDKKETMEAAGYRWPAAGGPGGGGGFGGGGGQMPRNPFKEGDGSKHLKSLVGTLGKS